MKIIAAVRRATTQAIAIRSWRSCFDRQSAESNIDQRKKLVWEIEKKLTEDGARPIIFYNRFAYCWQPRVKGWTMMANSIINNFRLEDVWLDK